jgi:hypothetical protein
MANAEELARGALGEIAPVALPLGALDAFGWQIPEEKGALPAATSPMNAPELVETTVMSPLTAQAAFDLDKTDEVLGDLGIGAIDGFVQLVNAVTDTVGLSGAQKWVEDLTAPLTIEYDEPTGAAAFTSDLVQAGIGMIPIARGLQGLGMVGNFLRWSAAGFITDFAGFDPDEPMIGELAAGIGKLDNESAEAVRSLLQEALEKDMTDNEFTKRLKNASGGLLVGGIFDSVAGTIRAARTLSKNPKLKQPVLDFLSGIGKTARQRFKEGKSPFPVGMSIEEVSSKLARTDEPVSVADPFYSKALQNIEDSTTGSATGAQWKKTLENAGIKKEEMLWLGLDRFLDSSTSISREDLVKHLRANQIEVEEITKTNKQDLTEWDQNLFDVDADGRPVRLTTQYHSPDYNLPGGSNYRETLLTVPPKTPTTFEVRKGADGYGVFNADTGEMLSTTHTMSQKNVNELVRIWRQNNTFDDPFISDHWTEPNVFAHVRYDERTGITPENAGEKILFMQELQSDWHKKGRTLGYIDPANVGKIEVFNPRTGQVVRAFDTIKEARAFMLERPDELLDYARFGDRGKYSGVPDAPFKKTWHELAFRSMVRRAAEEGFDRIAWTTGNQQVDRYQGELRNFVDRVEWTKTEDGVHLVGYIHIPSFEGGGGPTGIGRVTFPSQEKKVVDTMEKENAVSDAIGKSMADRIKNDPNQTGIFEGEDLKIDSTGMAGFYDRILPSYAKKFGKKFGAKVDMVEITGVKNKPISFEEYASSPALQDDLYEYFPDVYELVDIANNPGLDRRLNEAYLKFLDSRKPEQVHSMAITDKMRETAMKKGFPLFSAGALSIGALGEIMDSEETNTPQEY